MQLVENITKNELGRIKQIVGEAFVTNELFHELGSVDQRRDIVMKYMDAYVDYVYQVKGLYQLEGRNAYIGLIQSDQNQFWPQLKMVWRIYRCIPSKTRKRFIHHLKQIANSNQQYAKSLHMEVLMVCVRKADQGKGYATTLVEFAKMMAKEKNLPLLIDTDMKKYAQMYQHLGCRLYHSVVADNGVTRYNLIVQP